MGFKGSANAGSSSLTYEVYMRINTSLTMARIFYYIRYMGSWILRILILLISANVAYGTQGDIYADKIQALLQDPDTHISYSLSSNNDLFFSTKCNTPTKSRGFIKPLRSLQNWEGIGCICFKSLQIISTCSNQEELIFITVQMTRWMVFPHHFFS